MSDPSLAEERLRAALRELAAADAPGLVERARSRAQVRAERLIEDALVEELLAAAGRRPAPPVQTPVEADTVERAAREHGGSRTAPSLAAGEESGQRGPEPGDAWWTYCILRAQDGEMMAPRLEGIERGGCVEAVRDGELAALVSPVPLAEYGDEQLRANLEDLEWVERTARRHEAVLEEVLREATLVPLRLCTLYRDRDGVRHLLREQRAALREGLSRVDGCLEWGVKVFADPHAQRRQPPAESPEAGTPGASYLARRQRERALAEKASEVRARCVEVVHQRIGALARVPTTNPPQRPELHGRELTMLLNGAYLIERDRTPELEKTVVTLQEEWQALGFSIELTGPWPPYNFVSGAAGVLS